METTKALQITFDDPYRTPLPCVVTMVVVGQVKKDWLAKLEEVLGQPVQLLSTDDCFTLIVGDIHYTVTVQVLYNVYL